MKEKSSTPVTKARLRALPHSPGVYLMKDEVGEVLYVGKAKNLHDRVRSYFSGGDSRNSVEYLLEKVCFVETLVTEDERQALLLESDLIKKFKPHYNIRLKDDKAHLIVRIDMQHQWPKLELVRKKFDDGARYIGPFVFSYELRSLMELIKRTVPLRTCSDRVIYNRVRPCLEYQIKRCAAPCCLEVDSTQYSAWLEQAVELLNGRADEVLRSLESDMAIASTELRFEDAAVCRDRLEVLKRIGAERQQADYGDGAIDAFAVYREGSNIEVSILRVYSGRIAESKTYGFSRAEMPTEEIISSVVGQFYQQVEGLPDVVVLPCALEDSAAHEEIFSAKRGKAVKLVYPQRGSKARLAALASENAKENFEARFSDVAKSDRVLTALQIELGLEQMPRTIECVDISHFQGGSTVGAVVVFVDGKPQRSLYRCFHLTQEGKPDDFASMNEVVRRYLSRAAEENTLADLMVIDGGPPQLVQALAVRTELGLDKPQLIGLAKKRLASSAYRALHGPSLRQKVKKPERIWAEAAEVPIVLNANSEALHLLERIRNEAHRFAITFHRKTRAKRVFRSELDKIPGVGPARRNKLLLEFRSVDAIRSATAEELSSRCSIPLALAKRIVDSLNY